MRGGGNRERALKGDIKKINKNTFKTLGRLLEYLKSYKLFLFFAVIFAILGTVFDIIGPLIMGNTTNYVIQSIRNQGNIDYGEFMRFIYLLVGIYVFSALAEFVRFRMGIKVNVEVTYKLREDISKKLKRLPISYFDKNPVGDVLSRMTNDVQSISESISQIINQFISSLITIIGIMGIMFYISPTLALITILTIPLTALASFKILQESQKQFSLQWKDLGDLNTHIEEMYSSNKLVKSYNYEDESLEQFEEKNTKLRTSAARADFFSGITMPISMFVNNIGVVFMSVIGGYLILMGQINIGNFQSFVQYSRSFTRPITMMTDIISILQSGIAAAERVFEILDAKEEVPDCEDCISIEGIKPRVSFENVSFGYDEEEVIHNLSIDIPEGATVAIVGPTGSGKTTLVNLLMRFYDVNKGEIKIDGINIKNFSRTDLRNYFGMVLQDTWLFEGTVFENIAYGEMNSTREEVIEAAKNAYAHDFITKLPLEYDTILEENASNISEGQKQLLTIARALISNPRIMILDEATSSIDTRTERLIQLAMERLVSGRTSFIIAHRLSTIVNADLILVLKDGDIIEKGTHKELLEQGGFYNELYYSQF